MSKPIVASYCTTFLKPEMRHIYRQVTGLQQYDTFVLTRERKCEEQFPFGDIELIPRARKNFLKRFWLKYIRRLPPVYYRGELQVIIKLFERRLADLMHVYFGHTGVHLLPFIKEWDKPCVVSFHGMDIQSRPDQPGYDDQMRDLLRTIPLVLARSRSLMERLEQLGCPPEKLRLNRTGIPLQDFPARERTVPEDGAWQFVQACRLIEKKGLKTALGAFAEFRAAHPKAKFTIAGEGPMRPEIEQTVRDLNLGGAVELRGFLSQAELAALYAQSHIFLHPSEMTADQNQEGVPNSMLEAMATGLPVLATLHGGIPEAVTHEKTGLLVAERDQPALVDAMRRLTANGGLYSEYGREAACSVREEFSHERAIERLESFYDEARQVPASWRKPGSAASRSAAPVLSIPALPEPVIAKGHSFCYLFERFPSFVQTFVYREAVEMVRQRMNPLLVSIRRPDDPANLAEKLDEEILYLPEEKPLRNEVDRRRETKQLTAKAHRAIPRHRGENDSQRMFEAVWLGPLLLKAGIHHVHAHFGGMAARTAWWLRRLYGIRYSFTGHANDIFCATEFPVSNADLVRDADFVVTETDFARRWMEEKYPFARGKVHRVFNGIAFEGFPPREQAGPIPRIVSVGRYVEKKGFGDLIEACAALAREGRSFECQIIGGGPLHNELQAQIDRLQLGACVKLLGPKPQGEVRALLAGAAVFALACVPEEGGGSDNLPTVIMEAMACGVPVVSTTLAGVPEMIADGQSGLLVSPKDPASLARAIARLLEDPALGERLGSAGHIEANEKFDVAKSAAQLKRLLAETGRVTVPAAAKEFDPSWRLAVRKGLLDGLFNK